MPSRGISNESLANMCDIVENALEEIVIQFRGQFFAEGMEEKLRVHFETRLAAHIANKGANIENLPDTQKQYIHNRINRALELYQKEYES